MPEYASIRRSRKNGQLRRTSSRCARSTSPREFLRDRWSLRRSRLRADRREGSAPEFDPGAARRGNFVPHAIHCRDVHPVRNRVSALHGAPRVTLGMRRILLSRWDASRSPWDRTKCKRLEAASRAPSGYHWSQQISVAILPTLRIERSKTKIPRREIKFFVVSRIVGNMHLAVEAGDLAIRIDDGGGIVVNARSAALEYGQRSERLLLCAQWPRAPPWSVPAPVRPDRKMRRLRAGKNIANETVQAGTPLAHRRVPLLPRARSRYSNCPPSPAIDIWTRPTVNLFGGNMN